MKRFIISILSAVFFCFGYVSLAGFLWGHYKLTDATLKRILFPLDFIRYIYQDLLHFPYPNKIWMYALDCVFTIALYTALFYLAFTLFNKVTQKPKLDGIETPPEPPNFNH